MPKTPEEIIKIIKEVGDKYTWDKIWVAYLNKYGESLDRKFNGFDYPEYKRIVEAMRFESLILLSFGK